MHLPLPLLIAFAVSAFATQSAAAAPTVQERVFDPLCVSQLELTAPQESIDALYADPKGDYQSATMAFDLCGDGTQVYGPSPVTFRLKGSGSFRTLDGKAAFKVKMPSGSRIDGLKSFTLNNMVQDWSMIHETLAFEAFRAAGVPAARAGYATVTLNGSDYGLHANVETLDSRFLAAHFASTEHLYEGPDWTDSNIEHDSRDVLPGALVNFEVDEGDEGDIGDLEALAAVSVLENDDDWWAAFQDAYDVDRVLRYWAVELYVGNVDGYAFDVNNYFLHSTEAGKFTFLPWGLDAAFTVALPLDGAGAVGVVAERCFGYPACAAQFATAMDEVHEDIRDLALTARARTINSAIAATVAIDARREMSVRSQCLAVNDTIAFVETREQLWNEQFPGLNEPSPPQDTRLLDCGDSAGPVNETPASPAPVDSQLPTLLSARARRTGNLAYRLRVNAIDNDRVSKIQIRTRGSYTIVRDFSPDGRLTIKTAARVIRIRALDAAGNACAWQGLRLPR